MEWQQQHAENVAPILDDNYDFVFSIYFVLHLIITLSRNHQQIMNGHSYTDHEDMQQLWSIEFYNWMTIQQPPENMARILDDKFDFVCILFSSPHGNVLFHGPVGGMQYACKNVSYWTLHNSLVGRV